MVWWPHTLYVRNWPRVGQKPEPTRALLISNWTKSATKIVRGGWRERPATKSNFVSQNFEHVASPRAASHNEQSDIAFELYHSALLVCAFGKCRTLC